MTKKQNQKRSPISAAILEMAADQHRIGVMDDLSYRKITVRLLDKESLGMTQPISGPEIRALRENAHLSQAAFACYLNLTPGYISQLERGTKQPKGPALTLLNVIRRKGLEALL
jgi:putative transcriptional regulator